MSLSVIILSYKRPKNIGKVVESVLQSTSLPEEIFVFNNNPEISLKVDNAIVINSGYNFGCKVRHAIGMCVDTSHVLFIDDDVMLKKTTIADFENWASVYPDAILGLWGRKLAKGKKPYSQAEGIGLDPVNAFEVDVVIGRVHYCKKEKLALPFVGGHNTTEDDIALSLANKKAGFKNYVIPSFGIKNLPSGEYSLCQRPDHFERRDKACL